jgi:uncharacterized protein (TIGR03437 family)
VTIHIPRLAVLAIAVSGIVARGQNQIVSGGFTYGPTLLAVAPGEILTLVTPALNVPDAAATTLPLPASLSGVSVSVRVIGATETTGYPASLPILSIYTQNTGQLPNGAECPGTPNVYCSSTQITVEIPTEGVCAPSPLSHGPTVCPAGPPFPNLPPLLLLNVVANGVTGPDFTVKVFEGAPRLLSSCDSIFGPPSSTCHSLVNHADGSLVTATDSSPAKVGETITVWAVGLEGLGGPPSGTAPATTVELLASDGSVVFTYNYPVPAGPFLPGGIQSVAAVSQTIVDPEWVGLIPGYVGLYQINVTVPAAPAQSYLACGSVGNASITFTNLNSGLVSLCVQP